MITALVMAGGRSERMRKTFGPDHKALVPVLGVGLLERNVCTLLASGFKDIVIAISTDSPQLESVVNERCSALAGSRNAVVQCVRESQPLGTIGVAGRLFGKSNTVLVINVDNLTTLDLQRLVSHHEHSGAAMTVATHSESMRLAFGELEIRGGLVQNYAEKPDLHFTISSGTYVLGPAALSILSTAGRMDVPDLFAHLKNAGLLIAAFEHEEPWIDVNDAAAVERAEQLVAAHWKSFELWRQKPDREVVELLIHSPRGVLVGRMKSQSRQQPDMWNFPTETVNSSDRAPVDALARETQAETAWQSLEFKLLAAFDELEVGTGNLVRHHLYSAAAEDMLTGQCGDARFKWLQFDCERIDVPLSPTAPRSLAFLRSRI